MDDDGYISTITINLQVYFKHLVLSPNKTLHGPYIYTSSIKL